MALQLEDGDHEDRSLCKESMESLLVKMTAVWPKDTYLWKAVGMIGGRPSFWIESIQDWRGRAIILQACGIISCSAGY